MFHLIHLFPGVNSMKIGAVATSVREAMRNLGFAGRERLGFGYTLPLFREERERIHDLAIRYGMEFVNTHLAAQCAKSCFGLENNPPVHEKSHVPLDYYQIPDLSDRDGDSEFQAFLDAEGRFCHCG